MAQCVAGGRPIAIGMGRMARSTGSSTAHRFALRPSFIRSSNKLKLHRGLPTPQAVDPASVVDAVSATQTVYDLAGLDSATAGLLATILRPVLSISSLLMIVRIVMTWYPEIDATKMPWTIAYTPAESLLAATRKVVKPFNGLDVSPIVWVALLSLASEILTGPQGILSLIQRKGI